MLQNRFSENYLEVGCDEAGRGCLAGPVFAGAVILPDDFYHPLLNDSKQLTEKQRELLRPIIEKEAVEWAVVAVSAEEIDQINILNASIIGMHRCVDQLVTRPELILVDGIALNPMSESYTNVSSKETANSSPLQPLLSLPKHTVMNTWRYCTNSFHTTAGTSTKVTPPKRIVPQLRNTAHARITA